MMPLGAGSRARRVGRSGSTRLEARHLAAAKLPGLKLGVGPNGISIFGKTWKRNGAAPGLAISPVTATSTNVTTQDDTGHFRTGFGSLSREIRAGIDSQA